MRRFTAGQTIAVETTIAGTGALTDEMFSARAYAQAGHPMDAAATVTDAGAREVTINVSADQWPANSGGYGRLELMMTKDGVKSVELAEEFRIMPGLSVAPRHPFSDYRLA